MQQWVDWLMPSSYVRLYTKQHAHEIWTVLYCDGSACCIIHKYGGVLPGLQRKIYITVMQKDFAHTDTSRPCVSYCSPAAPAAPARWRWISCCYFLIQRSSPVSCKYILEELNIVFQNSNVHPSSAKCLKSLIVLGNMLTCFLTES